MKVCKGNILSKKSDPCYIELSNTYYLLAELSENLSQTYTPPSTDIQFRVRADKRLQKKNDKLNKYMYANINNDSELINAAVILAEYERTVRAKKEITNVR